MAFLAESTVSITTEDGERTLSVVKDIHTYSRKPEENEDPRQGNGALWYYCTFCPISTNKPSRFASTTGLRNHVTRHHPDKVVGRDRTQDQALIIRLSELYNEARARNMTQQIEEEVLKASIQKRAIVKALIDLIVVRSLSLSIVEWPEFQVFCRTLNPQFDLFKFESIVTPLLGIPRSHSTLRSWIETEYRIQKDVVRKTLQSAKSLIHISLDVWTSPNLYLLLGVCSHFINIESVRQTVTLGLRPVSGHAGEIQFNEGLLPILQEFGIARQLGTIVGDNASTNDTLCRTISNFLKKEFPRDPEWIARQQRIRCMGHMINLVVQAFLFPNKDELVELETYDDQEELDKEIEEQSRAERKSKIRTILGPLGKLHNIVVHIRSSPQRTAAFEKEAGRRIPLDNRTRWNSWFNMLNAVFENTQGIPNHIDQYCSEHSEQLSSDELSSNEWTQLRTIHQYLTPFAEVTLRAEGRTASLDVILDCLDLCLFELKQHKVRYL
jgi:hypothetical protein